MQKRCMLNGEPSLFRFGCCWCSNSQMRTEFDRGSRLAVHFLFKFGRPLFV